MVVACKLMNYERKCSNNTHAFKVVTTSTSKDITVRSGKNVQGNKK